MVKRRQKPEMVLVRISKQVAYGLGLVPLPLGYARVTLDQARSLGLVPIRK